jgi:ABC-type multidrug transport system ATPase subunit
MPFSNQINIQLQDLGKKFGSEWIFRNIDLSINPSSKMVILGGNGSGKSTLLQVISGYVLPNQGKVIYASNTGVIETENVKDQISLASPYLELIEEFSLPELVEHCSLYKPFLKGIDTNSFLEISELAHTKQKAIKLFSSGMKQRVKLALAVLAEAPVVLLDEPASNLDKNAIRWYGRMIGTYAAHKTVIVCSNSIKEEFEFCTRELNLGDYKKN